MRYILPILAATMMVARPAPLASAPPVPVEDRGNQLVAAAVQSLLAQPSLEAKVRQRAKIFGQYVSGAGLYLQLRSEDQTLVRYEFKLQVADQGMSFLHVNDGTTLWIRQDQAGMQSQAYVNVRRLREAQKRKMGMGGSIYSPHVATPEFALGGISQVLHGLTQNFNFAMPRESELSGVPLWEVAGSWKTAKLVTLLPDPKAALEAGHPVNTEALPAHLPDTVRLLLGRDQAFHLFPYRIEFARSVPKRDKGSPARSTEVHEVTPLVTIELFEVRRRPDLTAADFAFLPSDENVEDRTDQYLRKFGLLSRD